jgi:predicted dehydrogenase
MKIRTALLSYGLSGKVFHAPFLQLHPGFEIAGCWERSKKIFQEDYPGTLSYPSLEALLNDESVELVVVNTPTYTHYQYARTCLLAGKHVIVEKAFTANATEAEDLKKIAAEMGKKIAVFQNRRWDSDFLTVKKVIESGVLGSIKEAELHFDRYNPSLSPKPHKETPSDGSGILKDLGPHLIDQALCLFGWPEAVFCDLSITREHSLVDDCLDLLLYYPNLRVRLKSGYIVKQPIPSFVVHGSKGSFLKSRADLQEPSLVAGMKPDDARYGIEMAGEEGLLVTDNDGSTLKQLQPTEKGNYIHFFEGVYQALRSVSEMPVTADDGWRIMKIMDAAYESSKTGKVVGLPG